MFRSLLPVALVLTAPVAVAAQQPDYSAPAGAPYTAERVVVPTPMGHVLVGTLTLPKGANRSKPVAVIVTISGTGPQDRDETMGPPSYRPFRQIADSLGRRGIAVLRMDDRGTGESKGTFAGTTHFEFTDDIRAGLAYLRTRPEIDPKRMGLVGHSEGAIDAPIIATKEPELKALVLLAGQARALVESLRKQLIDLTKHDPKLSQELKDSRIKNVQVMVDSILATDRYIKVLVTYDPSATARQVSKPAVLILTGATDKQADPSQVQEWIDAFKAAGNKDVSGQVLPNLNHLFMYDTNGSPSGYFKGDVPAQVDPLVIGLVVDWLVQRLR